jgi:DNA-binding winged helix-turn-helix (wHTH) protein/tetratricopeptide (TPR) repeat protein
MDHAVSGMSNWLFSRIFVVLCRPSPNFSAMDSTTLPSPVVRFGVFEADLRSGELRKNGVRVKIQDLPFRALKLLISRPNEVLSREEFRQALWPDGVFVDFDHGISSAINRLRDALGDSAGNPRFIETVDRRGYRWIAPTSRQEPVVAPETYAGGGGLTTAVAPTPSPRRAWMLVLSAFVALAITVVGLSYWATHPGVDRNGDSTAGATLHPSTPAHHVPNAEAEDLYLKGRYYWNKRTPDALNKALDYFTQAIVKDSNYAPAYVGLANCYNLLREYTAMPEDEAYPRALAAAKKAVELDDTLAEAHASLGFILFFWRWDPAGAEHEFQRALELDPNDVTAHHWYATTLSAAGREDEALVEIEKARKLDPTSASVLADKGVLLFNAGQTEQAIALLQQMEATEPEFSSPHRYLADIYLVTGNYLPYIAESRKTARLSQNAQGLAMAQSAEKGFARNGGPGLIEALLKTQKKFYQEGQLSPYRLAASYALLGQKQEALQYLQTTYDRHDASFLLIATDRALINLHKEPQYWELVARLGLRPVG